MPSFIEADGLLINMDHVAYIDIEHPGYAIAVHWTEVVGEKALCIKSDPGGVTKLRESIRRQVLLPQIKSLYMQDLGGGIVREPSP